MLAVGAGVLLAGYSLLFWGNRIRSGNRISFADAVIPGHYEGSSSTGPGGRTIIGYNQPPGGVGPPSPIYSNP